MLKIGLLQKANLLLNKRLTFCDFIKKNKIIKCAILKNHSQFYFISESFGFDGFSLLNSFSTYDFWNGTIPKKNTIYNFSIQNTNLNQFYQFFSSQQKEEISSLSIIKTFDNSIFILINSSINSRILNDFEHIDFEKETYIKNHNFQKENMQKCILDLNNSVEDFVFLENKNTFYNDFLSTSIKNEIQNRLTLKYKDFFIIEKKSENLYDFTFTKNTIQMEFLKKEISELLKEIIYEHSKKIILKYEER